MIDLHAHILPGLDDGPPTTEAALEHGARRRRRRHARDGDDLARRLPRTTSRPAEIVPAREALAARLAEAGIELELLAGGEIAPDRLPELDDEALRALALGGGPYVLLECPFSPVGVEHGDDGRRPAAARLRRAARPPRALAELPARPGLLARLVDAGALAQVTTGSLTGGFGETARRRGAAMLQQGLVHVLASDAHDEVHRGPDLHAADGVLDAAQYEWMTDGGAGGDRRRPPAARAPSAAARARHARRLRSWSAR